MVQPVTGGEGSQGEKDGGGEQSGAGRALGACDVSGFLFGSSFSQTQNRWRRGDEWRQPGGHWGLWAGGKAVSAINNLFLGATQEGVVMATSCAGLTVASLSCPSPLSSSRPPSPSPRFSCGDVVLTGAVAAPSPSPRGRG